MITPVFAAAEEDSGGSFLVSPDVGLMIWTLVAFGITAYILKKVAFPRIAEAIDKRRRAIEESIDAAERTKQEADELLEEYRARLKEAREQAEDIVVRARRAGDTFRDESKQAAVKCATASSRTLRCTRVWSKRWRRPALR